MPHPKSLIGMLIKAQQERITAISNKFSYWEACQRIDELEECLRRISKDCSMSADTEDQINKLLQTKKEPDHD